MSHNNQETNTLELFTSENTIETFIENIWPFVTYNTLSQGRPQTLQTTQLNENTTIEDAANIKFGLGVEFISQNAVNCSKAPPYYLEFNFFEKETNTLVGNPKTFFNRQEIGKRAVDGENFKRGVMIAASAQVAYDSADIYGKTMDMSYKVSGMDGSTGDLSVPIGASIYPRNIITPVNPRIVFNAAEALPGQTFNATITADNSPNPELMFRYYENAPLGTSFGLFIGYELFATGETTYTFKIPDSATTGDSFAGQVFIDYEVYSPDPGTPSPQLIMSGTVGGGS